MAGRAWRDSTSAVGPSARRSASRHATAVSYGVAGTPDLEAGNEPQARDVLDRLVRGTVLAQADRVVRVDVDHALAHERGHAHGVARVVGEHQERAAEGDQPAVQRHAVHHRRHAELAHAVREVVAAAFAAHGPASRPAREVGMREVGRAADELRERRRHGGERALRGLARGERLGLGAQRREVAVHGGRESRGQRRPTSRARTRARRPDGARRSARSARAIRPPRPAPRARASKPCVDRGRHLERSVGPAEVAARRLDLGRAERRAVRVGRAGAPGASVADGGAADDERRARATRAPRRARDPPRSTSWPVDAVDTFQPYARKRAAVSSVTGAELAAICSNSPHVVFDEVQRRSPLPLVSIVEAARDEAATRGSQRPGLLGTAFTMQADFYPETFRNRGMQMVVPPAEDRADPPQALRRDRAWDLQGRDPRPAAGRRRAHDPTRRDRCARPGVHRTAADPDQGRVRDPVPKHDRRARRRDCPCCSVTPAADPWPCEANGTGKRTNGLNRQPVPKDPWPRWETLLPESAKRPGTVPSCRTGSGIQNASGFRLPPE